MEQNLQTIFANREEIMKDKWNENRPTKLRCATSSSKKSRKSQSSVAVRSKSEISRWLQTYSTPQRYTNGETIYHLLARENEAVSIRELLQQGFEAETDDNGFYPWHTAASYGNIEAMASFYEHRNSNFNEPCNHFGFSVLHIAVLGIGNTEQQAKMIEYIVNNISETVINETDVYGRTPLFCAAQYRKHKLGEVLLRLGADPEVITSFKYSALGMASTGCPNLMMSLMDW